MNRPAVLLIYDRTTLRRIWMISQEAFCSNRSSLVIFCAHFPGGNDGIPMAISQTHLYRAGSRPTIPKLQDKGRKNPRGTAYTHISMVSQISPNFVSPPARNTPAIRAVFTAEPII